MLVLLVLPLFSWAQDDNESTKRLLTIYMPEHCAMSGQFEQKKQLPSLPIPIVSQGDFFFYCELGVVWRTVEPFEDILIYTPHNRYFRIDDKSKVSSLNGLVHHNIAKILLAMLSGDKDFFIEKFSITQTEEDSALALEPKSQWLKKGINKITLRKTIPTNVVQLIIHSASSEVTMLSIVDVNNRSVSAKSAAFDACVESMLAKQACEVLRYPSRFNVQ